MGRQCMWLIFDYYKTDEHMGLSFGYKDLEGCTWLGDDRMEEFICYWDHMEENMEDQGCSEIWKRDTLLDHMRKSTVLKEDLAHYDRKETGHPDHTYAFLRKAINTQIRLQRKNTIVEQ